MTAQRARPRHAAVSLIGIDLAWSPQNATGVAALTPRTRGLVVAASAIVRTDDEIVAFATAHLAPTTIVMIDAPLVVPNHTGMRACDRLTHVEFGAAEAGAYPANRATMGAYTGGVPRGEAIARHLAALGFPWPPGTLPHRSARRGRWVFECYPHPAQVVLFGLATTLKYKKKRQAWPAARAAFRRYLAHVEALRRPRLLLDPSLRAELDPSRAIGRAYKEREDRLDAIFCAYLGALALDGRLRMLGHPSAGSIVVPRGEVRAQPPPAPRSRTTSRTPSTTRASRT